ncbi:conserved Plasmodium protein, unknown function [Plasmodium gallinaceum]|uniref:SPX domain-containing protein n=1 Tax=Plasmodium gallinaceum TaxID=5849 RepID=A0A1J1GR95_PLAGA|nr:conserved Plasmodium protein, unknown function [Plasmodium gallinaceum]CRG93799.1 conserved Plasmodium protein, unknown function [Plasmodium gallinaceum]
MDDIPNHYRKYYVSYKKIKRTIIKMSRKYKKKLEKDLIQNAAKKVDKQGIKMLPPFLFNDIISQEIRKVNKFAENKYNDIIDNLINIYKLLKSLEYNKSGIEKDDIEKQLDLIGCDIIHFDFYIHKNSKIIMKLGFFFDKVMNISINQWLLLSLIKEKFCNINIDNLIVYLSFLYTLLRSLNENVENMNKSNKWKPPDTFERTSTKFLIKYDDIVYTKVKIVKHLPYLIFDFSNEDLENHFKYFIKNEKYKSFNVKKNMNDNDNSFKQFNESQQITSVYFDNKQASCYTKRILRYENAQLIRFRWYNDNEGDPNKTIFIERKIHHEEWTGETSTKERFELDQKYVLKFMNGELNIRDFFLKKLSKKKKELLKNNNNNNENNFSLEERINKSIQLGSEIQRKILKNKLEPIIRTSYLRSAFQLTNDNAVRISIDTNISMLNEYVEKREHWCRLAEEALGKNEIIRLNYGIIEVKLKVENMPEWINNILNSNKSINAYKYSKYQTAMALLHSEKIKYIPIWIYKNIHEHFKSSNNLSSSMLKNSCNYQEGRKDLHSVNINELSNNQKYKNNITSNDYMNQFNLSRYNTLQKWNLLDKTFFWLNNKYSQKDNKSKNINLLKIDPKINFAAERTFLHYSLMSVYINLLALFLEKYKNKNRNLDFIIILLFLASFISLISSYVAYLKRIDTIQKRKTREPLKGRLRFDSFFSPLIFLLLLFFSIILSFYFNFKFKTKRIP